MTKTIKIKPNPSISYQTLLAVVEHYIWINQFGIVGGTFGIETYNHPVFIVVKEQTFLVKVRENKYNYTFKIWQKEWK